MNLPLTVTFRDVTPSEWIEADIRKRVTKLETYCRHITSCRVVVDIPHRHHRMGNCFTIHIDLTVPGEEIAVTHGSNVYGFARNLDETDGGKVDIKETRKDLRLVIKEVFDVAQRRLQEHSRRHRLEVKRHNHSPRGQARVRRKPAR
jgi:ribosome-associated translation inhibitor RaiA